MKLLVNHSSGNNLGDMAMIEGVIRRLTQLSNNLQLYVKDNLWLPQEIWTWNNVNKITLELLRDPVACFPIIKQIPVLRLNQKIKLAHLMLERGLNASEIQITEELDSSTLGNWCSDYDAMHFVGMGGLTDVFIRDTWYYCCLMHTFATQGKPVIFTGQQIGPINSWVTKNLIQRALRKVEFVGLREPTDSLLFCKQAKLNPDCFSVMGDDSFGLPAATLEQVESFLSPYNLVSGKFIAVNLRIAGYAGSNTEYIHKIADFLSHLSQRYDLPIVVVPIALDEYDSDIDSGYLLAEAIGGDRIKVLDEPEKLSAALVKGVLGQAYAAIGVSYHFCTFALSQGVPAICIFDGAYYSQKARGISRFWGDERLALPLSQLNIEDASKQASELIEDQKFRALLQIRAEMAIKQWEQTFDNQVNKMLNKLI